MREGGAPAPRTVVPPLLRNVLVDKPGRELTARSIQGCIHASIWGHVRCWR